MAKYYGSVGYVKTVEKDDPEFPGVFETVETVKKYSGDVLSYSRRWKTSENLNDDITISNRISIIADPYAFQNLSFIRYVVWMGVKWKVTDVEVQYPRLILSVGGVYNGEQT